MERWVLYATLSMLFAGFTSVIAKMGMEGISAELGLSVRTLFVCGFVFVFALMFVDPAELPRLNGRSLMWLCISGATTALSWIFYYKAIKEGHDPGLDPAARGHHPAHGDRRDADRVGAAGDGAQVGISTVQRA